MKKIKYKIIPAFCWDPLTPYYDALVGLAGFGKALDKRTLANTKLESRARVLDVGAGTGSFIKLIKRRYPNLEITGIDADPRVLEIAKRKLARKNIQSKLILAKAEKLPFKSGSFDYVFSTLVFHHLPSGAKETATREIYRILKPKGIFFLTDFDKPYSWQTKAFFKIAAYFEEQEYLGGNITGKIPTYLTTAGFKLKRLRPPYRGVSFIQAKKA